MSPQPDFKIRRRGDGMDFGALLASLPNKKRSAFVFDKGKVFKHSFAELARDVARAADNLRRWGIGAGNRVGIYAPNCYPWLVYDLAIIKIGAVSVPFTDDFTGKIDRAVLDKYQVSLLLISKNRMPGAMQPYMAYIDAENAADISAIPRPADADPDDLTMAFSSGSAGGLKGLQISRGGVEATLPPILEVIGTRSDDRLLLFMPMSNFQQRTMCYAAIWYDFDIIITDYVQLLAAMKALDPTILIAPPMYFQMIYARFANFSSLKRAIWTAFGKLVSVLPIPALRRAMASSMFVEFYQQFGGRMRMLITGMAPIKHDVAKFFDLMQLPLCESYGLVETGSLTYRPADCKKYGSVGKPLRGIHLHIGEDGEVIVERQNSLTRRYFQSAEGENERTFLGNNRIATGDIGRLDNDGYLYLMGRKKELIITPGGYKIHPEIVERELADCPDIAQAAVFLKPGAATLTCVASLHQPGDEARTRTRAFVKSMKSTRQSQIGDVIFVDAPFSAENGMLRPNLKLDRRAIAAKFNLA
jgi:long-chain acyl-CoA synthetase